LPLQYFKTINMSLHFSMGAINKTTNKYENPKIAKKTNKYKCPCCERDVIFKNGKIKKPHFAHYKSDNPCTYYEKPNESQIHKDAKLLMKTLLDNKRSINIYRKCYYCEEEDTTDTEVTYVSNIKPEEYKNNTSPVIEYKFDYNNSKRSADVALLENNEIKYIFEICYKNKTKEENRPEPWFEINAETLINATNSGENMNEEGEIEIECIRDHKCVCCKDREENERNLHLLFLENLEKKQIKEKEQQLAKIELALMSKEDYRTIELQIKLEIEREMLRKKIEDERELKRKILEEEIIERIEKEKKKRKIEEEERIERIEKEKKIWKHSPSNNERCEICDINYCKCLKKNFIKDAYNILKCSNCNKRKCKCVRITEFFKQNK